MTFCEHRTLKSSRARCMSRFPARMRPVWSESDPLHDYRPCENVKEPEGTITTERLRRMRRCAFHVIENKL